MQYFQLCYPPSLPVLYWDPAVIHNIMTILSLFSTVLVVSYLILIIDFSRLSFMEAPSVKISFDLGSRPVVVAKLDRF